MCSVCSVPNHSAIRRAAGSSLKLAWSKPIENVLTAPLASCAIAATTADESIPPDSSAPTGTSATSRRLTAARMPSRISSCNASRSVTVRLVAKSRRQ